MRIKAGFYSFIVFGLLSAQAVNLKVVRASLFPELVSHHAPGLVTTQRAPEGQCFLRLEIYLEFGEDEHFKEEADMLLVVDGIKRKKTGEMQMARSRPSPWWFPGTTVINSMSSIGYDILYLVPETFRRGTLEFAALSAPVVVAGVGKAPVIGDDLHFTLTSARYGAPRRTWEKSGEEAERNTLVPMAGAILEVTLVGDSRRKRDLKALGDGAMRAREFSVMIPSRDLIPAFGFQGTVDESEEPDTTHFLSAGPPRPMTLLFAVPPSVPVVQLLYRGEIIGRVKVTP